MIIKGNFTEGSFYSYDYHISLEDMERFAGSLFDLKLYEVGLDGKRFDMVGFSKNGIITVCEFKISVADWKRDEKWKQYAKYCNQLYLMCPFGVINREEVARAGLIYCFRYRNNFLDIDWAVGGWVVKDSSKWSIELENERDILRKALWKLN